MPLQKYQFGRKLIAFSIILILISISSSFALADKEIGLWGEGFSYIYQCNGMVTITVTLDVGGDNTFVTDLIVATHPSDNLRFSFLKCIYDNGGAGEEILLSKPYDENTLDLSDVSFHSGIYKLLFTYEYLPSNIEYAELTLTVQQANVNIQGSRAVNFLAPGWTITLRDLIQFRNNPPVSNITLVSGNKAKAGIPYGIECSLSPKRSTNDIHWSVLDDGGTGAVITKDVLYTVGMGIVVLQATVDRGNRDGTDYVQQFTIKIEPLINPISMNMVKGITANDHFSSNQTITFSATSAAKNKSPQYGDYYYLPDQWFIHSTTVLTGHFESSEAKVKSSSLEIGTHTLTVMFKAMRFNGTKWVDAGNPYVIEFPFYITGKPPQTGDSMNIPLILLVTLFSSLFTIGFLKKAMLNR